MLCSVSIEKTPLSKQKKYQKYIVPVDEKDMNTIHNLLNKS